jgi:hypothetical protein
MSQSHYHLSLLSLFAAMGTVMGGAHASCGQAFCVVNTNWAMQGVPSDPESSRLDLHYEYIDQNKLWQGNRKISAADDTADTRENRTLNHNIVATYDYTASNAWGVSIAVPLQQRVHDHITDPTGTASYEKWDFTEMGDIKLMASYNITNDEDPLNNFGLQFGLKLPSGSRTVANGDGTRAERALQPGSGSTDVIIGTFYTHRGFGVGSTWFAQGTHQQAVMTRDDFRPGGVTSLTAGYTQPLAGALAGTLQLNALFKARDVGAQAEPDLSGGKYVFISPGLRYAASKSVQIYAYAQLPIYRFVNGIQLTADLAFVGGVTIRF